jgi:DNA-binding beta-propeller fold protein YncE
MRKLLLAVAPVVLGLGGEPARAVLPPGATEHFYVGDEHAHVLVYSASGEYLRSFTAPGLDGPYGIVHAGNGKIYVASRHSSEIYVFSHAEEYLGKFAHAELAGPQGMALSAAGELYVISTFNDRVCVFDLDGEFQRSIQHFAMESPMDLTFDGAGNLYVAAWTNYNVVKFDSNDDFVLSFTGGGLGFPRAISRSPNDVLYVSSYGAKVVKFNTSGIHLGQVQHADFDNPSGTAFDDQGHLWVLGGSDTIVEFDANDTYVQTITEGDLFAPRRIAFAAELQCPGAVENVRLQKLNAGVALRLTWNASPAAEHYTTYEDPEPDGTFSTPTGSSVAPGLVVPMPDESLYYLVAGSNLFCGEGPLH